MFSSTSTCSQCESRKKNWVFPFQTHGDGQLNDDLLSPKERHLLELISSRELQRQGEEHFCDHHFAKIIFSTLFVFCFFEEVGRPTCSRFMTNNTTTICVLGTKTTRTWSLEVGFREFEG